MNPAGASLQDALGRTPLIRLSRFPPRWFHDAGHELLLKCEFMNPNGSVKDRIAFRMIEGAERRGDLRPGGTIVEASAGNTGLALAAAAAQRGYKLVVVMTTKSSVEKVELMRAVGAEVVIVAKELKPDDPGALLNRARAIAQERPSAWWADQFSNADNVAVHFETTGPEIWSQTGGSVDVVVVGVGTGGSLTGIGRFLRRHSPDVRMVLADPQGSILADMVESGRAGEPGASVVEGIGGSIVPANADLSLVSHAIRVPDVESVRAIRRLMETEGMFAGGSTGCLLAATLRFARRHLASRDRPRRIVVLAPDGGRSYLSTFHNEAWRREHGFETTVDW